MKFLAIKRFYEYGENRGEINYLINLEEFISLKIDKQPDTREIVLKTKEHCFTGISIDCIWLEFNEFLLGKENIFPFVIYDRHYLIDDTDH